ncbi:MAG: hypothetical protein ACI4J2_07600, partial [Ruminococcus sp.]
MSNCSDSFNAPWAHKMDIENFEKYGTDDYETIRLIESYAEKVVGQKAEELSEEKSEEKLKAKKEEYCLQIRKEIREEFSIIKGEEIFRLSPFISETVQVNGYVLSREDFISRNFRRDPAYDEKRIELNPHNGHWQITHRTKGPTYISSVEVTGCLIVDATGPGICYAYMIFIKGRVSPLIFFNGDLSDNDIIKKLQLDETSLNKKYVAEAFRRSLCMCSYILFMSIPKYDGWNLTPDGLRKFVSSELDDPLFGKLFGDDKKSNKHRNVYQDIKIEPTDRTIEQIFEDFHRLIPNTLPVKISVVIAIMSRFLPFYKDEGIVQDRLWMIETSDDDTARYMASVLQNKNHCSIDTILSSKRHDYIIEEIKKYNDCVAIFRHSGYVENMYGLKKILKILFELLQNETIGDSENRTVPVLIIDNAGGVPEEFPAYCLSLNDSIRLENMEQAQKVLGELDYYMIKFAEQNPTAFSHLIKATLSATKHLVKELPCGDKSNSMLMFLSTAVLLKRVKILTGADVQSLAHWFGTESTSKTSLNVKICCEVGDVLSKAICSGEFQVARQDGPPYWHELKAFVGFDGSINMTAETFDRKIMSRLNLIKSRVKVFRALEDEDLSFSNSPREHQRTLTVCGEDGKKVKKRFVSFSRELLSEEAKRIVDETISSDLFHKPNKAINNFNPFIRHEHLGMVAGQVITEYKQGNPFICVTGSPGSGKTDFMMMQALLRAQSGDTVLVLDPTNSFCKDEQLGHKVPETIIKKYCVFWDISVKGFPVDVLDFNGCAENEQKVQRLYSLLTSGTHITGPKQKDILLDKVSLFIKDFDMGIKSSINEIVDYFGDNAEERKLQTRIKALFETVKKNETTPPGWEELLDSGKIVVISCGNATINVDANPLDIVLDTLYGFKDSHRESKATIILDEVQTLNHYKGCTLESVLSRGRKLNLSVILASQYFSNGVDALSRIYAYCGTFMFFRPMGE